MSDSNSTGKNHQLFCEVVGIVPYSATSNSSDALSKPVPNPNFPRGFYTRVLSDFNHHTYQYWFVATLSNAFLILQILLGTTLAALGGSVTAGATAVDINRAAVAITIIGALQTVIAGMISYFKSRNQPNRTRQFRNSLRRCKNAIEDAEMRFRNPSYTGDVMKVVDDLLEQYKQAVADAEMNYPDFWMVGGMLGTTKPGTAKDEDNQRLLDAAAQNEPSHSDDEGHSTHPPLHTE